MKLYAFILVFSSALLHATWHFMVKKSKPFPALFIPISGANLIFTFIFLATAKFHLADQPLAVYLMAAGGGACGVLCNLGLSRAYRTGEVSLTYPLARALPVLLTMLITGVFTIGRPLSLMSIAAMTTIFAGCLIMPLDSFGNIRKSDYINSTLPGIICAALGTTGYTIFDSIGVKLFLQNNPQLSNWHGSLAYSNLRETCLFTFLILSVLVIPEERKKMSRETFSSWQPYCAGVFAGIAYALILIAMPLVTNVSFVQAFRQVSLPIGMVLGVVFLKEKCHLPKIIGMILIVTGLVLAVV